MRPRRYSYNKKPKRVSGRFYVIVGTLLLGFSGFAAYKLDYLPKISKDQFSVENFSSLASFKWAYKIKDAVLGAEQQASPKVKEFPKSASIFDESERAAELAMLKDKQSSETPEQAEQVPSEAQVVDKVLTNLEEDKPEELPKLIVTEQEFVEDTPELTDGEKEILFIKSIILPTGAPQETVDRLAELVLELSILKGFDPLFVTAFVMSESSFREDVISENGKQGLMQIDAFRGEYVAKLAKMKWEGENRLLDAEYNLELGLGYFRFIENILKGDQRLALMAYAFGPRSFLNAVRVKAELPDRVYDFADKVLNLYSSYKKGYRAFFEEKPKTVAKKEIPVLQAKIEKKVLQEPIQKKELAQKLAAPKVAEASVEKIKQVIIAKEPKKKLALLEKKEFETPSEPVPQPAEVEPMKLEVAVTKKIVRKEEQVLDSEPEIAPEPEHERAMAAAAVFQSDIRVKQGADGIQFVPSEEELVKYVISESGSKTVDRDYLASIIVAKSEEHEVDPLLVTALIKGLSNFDSSYKSGNFRGLFAMKSRVVNQVAKKLNEKVAPSDLLDDDEANIDLHVAYLSYLDSHHGGNVRNAVMAFLWEPGLLSQASRTKQATPMEVRELTLEVFKIYNDVKSRFVVAPQEFLE